METVQGRRRTAPCGPGPALLIALVLLAGGCSGPDEPSSGRRASVEVETLRVEITRVPEFVAATGSIEPWVRVSPGTKILGRVERVLVREGDRVAAGQRLAWLEKRDLEAAVEQARAAVAMAQASLTNAQASAARMTELHGRGSVTDKNLEDATATFRVGEAALQQARAALSAAEVTLGYAEIVAPVSGWISRQELEPGDIATPGARLFTIEDLSKVKVAVELPESDVVGLSQGDPAHVRVDVLEHEWAAVVDRVLPAGDPLTRTFTVQLVLPNPDGELRSGMFARARFAHGTRETLSVPLSALVTRGQLVGLFVIDEGSVAHLRWVRLGREQDGRVEVISGLSEGERIVGAPPAGLADGTPVVAR